MIRNKTLDGILRQHAREKTALLEVISTQNDRLMLLTGIPYAPSPLDMHRLPEPDDEEEPPIDVGQLPDGLGDSW